MYLSAQATITTNDNITTMTTGCPQRNKADYISA